MAGYDGWELLQDGKLGSGGQGQVYKARSPKWVDQLALSAGSVEGLLRQVVAITHRPTWPAESHQKIEELAQKIVRLGSADPVEDLGALKQFKIPSDDKEEEASAVGRLESEVQALRKVSHPAVLKLLHSNVGERFIVTEYYPLGTLNRNLHRYQGNAVAAIQAFRTLVEGVLEIHKQGAIHRDIKPENIFVAASDQLVLGDFGIVFFQEGGRLTTTYERVGSHFWMAPWAYDNVRLNFNEIKPVLDIYPLGKVLWSMISGRNGFPFWEYDRDENNLENIFPYDPAMPLVNRVLAKCVVREEGDCRVSTAQSLLSEVDILINQIRLRGLREREDEAHTWPCRMCGRGTYRFRASIQMQIGTRDTTDHADFPYYVCSHCKHVEFFQGL